MYNLRGNKTLVDNRHNTCRLDGNSFPPPQQSVCVQICGFLLRGATPSFYVVAKPRVISTITITSASFLLCQYRRHDPGRHLCVSTSTFFFIPYGMPQLNVVRSRSPVSQECIANCGVPCSVSTGRPPASRPFYHLVTVISITFRRFFFSPTLGGVGLLRFLNGH